MRIYTKTGVMDITLRPLSENMQGDAAFCEREVGVMIDIKFTAYDGVKRYIVMGWSDQNPDIIFHGKAFHFVLHPVESQCVSKELKCPEK